MSGQMKCYVIQIKEHEDAIWSPPDFTPEVFLDEAVADDRCQELNCGCGEYCGFYYSVEEGILNNV